MSLRKHVPGPGNNKNISIAQVRVDTIRAGVAEAPPPPRPKAQRRTDLAVTFLQEVTQLVERPPQIHRETDNSGLSTRSLIMERIFISVPGSRIKEHVEFVDASL